MTVKYRYFEIKLSMFDISVSLWRWLDGNGKGLGKDAVVRGVRGVIGAHHFMSSHQPCLKTVVRSSGLLALILLRFTTFLNKSILKLNHLHLRMSLSPYTFSNFRADVGYATQAVVCSMTSSFRRQRVSSDNSTTVCLFSLASSAEYRENECTGS
jgi:hypothetical protein